MQRELRHLREIHENYNGMALTCKQTERHLIVYKRTCIIIYYIYGFNDSEYAEDDERYFIKDASLGKNE